MAGVTGDCKECGLPIFDEQTRTKLCDACEALPPSERLSGIRARESTNRVDNWLEGLRQARQNQIRTANAVRDRRVPTPDASSVARALVTENEELREQVKELESRLRAYEEKDKQQTAENASFLRKFGNLDTESEF